VSREKSENPHWIRALCHVSMSNPLLADWFTTRETATFGDLQDRKGWSKVMMRPKKDKTEKRIRGRGLQVKDVVAIFFRIAGLRKM